MFDENYFVKNIYLLDKLGISNAFIYNLKSQSPGPLYQFLHVIFEPFTHLDPVRMRIINFIFFLLTVFLTYYYFKTTHADHYLNKSLLYVSAPVIWVIVGLALTEVPAMMFLVLSIILLKISLDDNGRKQLNYFTSIIAGFCLGLAIMGRTQFLMVLPATPFLLFLKNKHFYVLAYVVSALIFPLWIFSIWHGLVPPDVQDSQKGFNFIYGFVALGYLSFITLFVCYKWFSMPRLFYIITAILFLAFLVINVNFHLTEFTPLTTAAHKIPASFIRNNYSYIMPSVLFGVGILYIFACIYQILENKNNHWFIFIIMAGLLIIATTVKSSAQFSSRYVAQSLPLFLIAYSGKIFINRRSMILGILGIIIGMISLSSYYLKYS